jgi:hypothetical protein
MRGSGDDRVARRWEAAGVSLVRPRDEGEHWVKLVLVTMAIWVLMFVTMAVIPSFWLYFADGTLKWTGKFTVPYGLGELVLPMQMVRDVIVVLWYGLALTGFGLSVPTTSATPGRCRPVRRSARPPVATGSRRRGRIDR